MTGFLEATRTAYDTIAGRYAERFHDELADQPLERALFTAFAELARDAGPVADLGCGAGLVTAHLYGLGLDVSGVDLSPGMLAEARRDHPGLRFEQGSMTALDLPDASLGAITAVYSIIHVPTDELPEMFAGFHRVLKPGGHVLIAVLVGDERLHRTEAFGHDISLDYYLRPPELLADEMTKAGLTVTARLSRERQAGESLPRAFLLARKPLESLDGVAARL